MITASIMKELSQSIKKGKLVIIFFSEYVEWSPKTCKNGLFQKKPKQSGREVENMEFLVVYIEEKEHLEIPAVN